MARKVLKKSFAKIPYLPKSAFGVDDVEDEPASSDGEHINNITRDVIIDGPVAVHCDVLIILYFLFNIKRSHSLNREKIILHFLRKFFIRKNKSRTFFLELQQNRCRRMHIFKAPHSQKKCVAKMNVLEVVYLLHIIQ